MSSALIVSFWCDSSTIMVKVKPLSIAFWICSTKFVRSLSLSALFPFLVSFSQLMKQASFSSKPEDIISDKSFVLLPWMYLSILALLCNSRLPFPGVSQTNTALFVLFRYSSIKCVRIMVLPLPVQLFRIISLLGSPIASIRASMALSWKFASVIPIFIPPILCSNNPE